MSDSIAFLQWFDPIGPWTVIAIEPTEAKGDNATVRVRTFADLTPAQQWIDNFNGTWNLYFTPNRCTPNIVTSPKKHEITHVRCFHVDLDMPKDFVGDATEEDINLMRAKVEQFNPPPHAITFSGGGVQAFWKFDEELKSEFHMSRIEAGNKAILRQVGGDGSCWNVNRLMRLPGTMNVLNAIKRERGRTPSKTRILRMDVEYKGWSYKTDPLPTVPEEAPKLNSKSSKSNDNGSVNSLPPKLKKHILLGDPAEFKGDRSRLVWHITCALIRANWSDDAITEVLLTKTFGCSDHIYDQSNPEQYARNQVAKAKESVENDWQRDEKGRIVTASSANAKKAITALGIRFGHNVFEKRSYLNGSGPMRPLNDEEVSALRFQVEEEYGFLPQKELFFDLVQVMAHKQKFNPLVSLLEKNQENWDHIPRIGSWLIDYAGAEDTPYTRAVGRLTLIAAVRRAREPGCKHDEILVLISEQQGTNKSSSLAALAIKSEWFTDNFPLHAKDKQVIEYLQGKWIIECSELAGIKQAQIEEVKAMLSRQVDSARLSYDRLPTDMPRQCIFIGTTNSTEFLRDLENRRYWCVVIKQFDLQRLKRDVMQLWAEAAYYESLGESIQLDESLWPDARQAQDQHRLEDPWAPLLAEALNDVEGRIMSEELFKIIGKPKHQRLPTDGNRLGEIMRDLGWKHKQLRFPGIRNPKWCYYYGNSRLPLYVTITDGGDAIVSASPNSMDYDSKIDKENNVPHMSDAEPAPF